MRLDNISANIRKLKFKYFRENIQRAIAIHGVWGTVRICFLNAFDYVFWFTPARRRSRVRDSEFDKKWGTDTQGKMIPDRADVVGSNWMHGVKYEGCDDTSLREVLEMIDIKYEDFTFVDLGSGKGRSIFVASHFPFQRIIGVEYSKKLCDISRYNLSYIPNTEKKCKAIDIINADAADYQIPEGALIIFLNNPFGGQVMKQVVHNVIASYRNAPRRIIVIYFVPHFADFWRKSKIFQEIERTKNRAIYDTDGLRY